MEFRAGPHDPCGTFLTVDEFLDMLRAGTVGPAALYRDPHSREWVPLGELPHFDVLSPTRRLGPRKREAEYERPAWALTAVRRRRHESYFHHRDLASVPPEQFAHESGTHMASRLFIRPGRDSAIVVSIAFRQDGLIVSCVTARPVPKDSPDPPTRAVPSFVHSAWVRRVARVPAAFAPVPMRSAVEFSTALSSFGLSESDYITDDVRYRHQYFDGESHPEVRGNIPDERADVLAGYWTLLRDFEPFV
jgi:hypothetical protein